MLGGFQEYDNRQPIVACTEEAKLCPDGSYVERILPDCEFVACPGGDISRKSMNAIAVDTSNWKTYRNEEYGFEVKYPPVWVFTEIGENIIEIHSGKTGVSDIASIEIMEGTDVSQAIQTHLSRYVVGTRIQREEDITVAGKSARLIYQNTGGINLPDDSKELSKWVFVIHEEKIVKIGIYGRYNNNDELFDKMLTAFKFIE